MANIVTIVDVTYRYGNRSYDAGCRFRFVALKDYRYGRFIPQPIIAEADAGSTRDRATCSGKLNAFNMYTGNADVTFTMNRRKF